jgi:C4-dicarboxylate-specific signal transduction histidine kinase
MAQLFGNLRQRLDALAARRTDPDSHLAYLVTLWLVGAVILAATTAICFWLELNAATAAFVYLIAIVFLSLLDSFVSSAVLSLIAVACLDFFFVTPLFTLQVDLGQDLVMLVAFVATSMVVTSLVRQVRDLGKANREKAELLALTKRLQQAQDELAYVTRVTTLGEITASIAHEVNQPLAAIVTSGETSLRFLALDPPELDEVREALTRMISDGKRAGDIVQRIRALAKKAETQTVRVDLNALARESATLLRQEIANHGAVVRLDLSADLPAVLGDRVQLQQVIINLIMNGVQAMAEIGGRSRELVIRTANNPAGALLAVQDCGIGLTPENAKRLFSPFFTTKPSGMGIGLSICRTIIESHGGRVWASGNDGPGATFQFTVPAAVTPDAA